MNRNCVSSRMDDVMASTGHMLHSKEVKGITFPENLGLGHLVVTGPPGVGKSTLMNQIGGWPQEGYVDLSLDRWWRSPALSYRPREVHLGFPFVGVSSGLAVFEEEWLNNHNILELDLDRIRIPPDSARLLTLDWKSRYVFEFILPPPEVLLEMREERGRRGRHLANRELTLEHVRHQVAIYWAVALHLHRSGMRVYVREGFTTNLHCFRVPLYEGVERSFPGTDGSLQDRCCDPFVQNLGSKDLAH